MHRNIIVYSILIFSSFAYSDANHSKIPQNKFGLLAQYFNFSCKILETCLEQPPTNFAKTTIEEAIADGDIFNFGQSSILKGGYGSRQNDPENNEIPPLYNGLSGLYGEVVTPGAPANPIAYTSATVWKPQSKPWSKSYVYPTIIQKCKNPVSVSVMVGVTYQVTISATGSIGVINVTGTGQGGLTASITGTWNFQACSAFQTVTIERYITYKQFIHYSDGTTKETGGVSNIRQPGRMGDVKFNQVSPWEATKVQ